MQILDASRHNAPATDSERMTDLPDLRRLRAEFEWNVTQRDANVFTRMAQNHDARYCLWPGQTSDGRRHYIRKGENEVFPWDGASDVRPMVVDTLIKEDVAMLMGAWRRMRLSVQGVEANDIEWGTRVTQLLRWMKYTQMTEAPREARLLANTLLERGTAIMGVFWCRETALTKGRLTLEELGQVAQAAQQALAAGQRDPKLDAVAQLLGMVLDPTMEETAAVVLRERLPHLTGARCRRLVADLRQNGVATFPLPQIVKDRPTVVALVPNEDVFIPPDEVDVENLRAIDRVEIISESRLRERVQTHDWDAEWVESVVSKGRGQQIPNVEFAQVDPLTLPGDSKMFQIVHSYRRRFDADGIPGIEVTVWHWNVTDRVASHGLLDYAHGKIPFVVWELEKISRAMDSARGYGEVLATLQNQVKAEMDSRIDRASLATVPPLFHPTHGAPTRWGPGVKIGTMQRDAYGYADIPRFDPGSKEVEETVRKLMDAYVGRPVDEQNVVRAQAMQQDLVDVWMEGWKQVDTQILQLCQQFLPDEIAFRVVGSDKARPIRASLREIQGQFDLTLNYNLQLLDMEYVKSILGVFKETAAFDRDGRLDYVQIIKTCFDMFDPNLGELAIEPGDTTAAREIEGEKGAWASILSGIDEDVQPAGQNHQLRLQVAQQLLAQNPTAQKRIAEDEHVKGLAEKRLKQLSFQVQQKGVNAQIGRLGA